ncbi:MAG TPA: cation diffusion facilitator family transporter [Candidatus Dormibacteraeota bacterium]|nr:cation diffusion facilitator family transporter [Candidatus Dormibacteraeota bacterium]
MRKNITARRVVITSFLVDLSDVILNVTAAILSGSVVVLTEAMQGAADLLTAGLLWMGVSRSKRRADRRHRFGYGKELFFWILMAGISMFFLTAGVSFYLGLQRFLHPRPIHNLEFAYLVLAIGVVTNAYALRLSLHRLHINRHTRVEDLWSRVGGSSFVETKATTILDLMGTTAAALGLVALVVYGVTGDLRFDGIGAMVVGLVSGIFAILLILEVKEFIIGRSAPQELEERIRKVAESVEGIKKVLDLRTMQMGSDRVLVNMEVHINRNLNAKQIEKLMDDLKKRVKTSVPEVQHIQVEIETP